MDEKAELQAEDTLQVAIIGASGKTGRKLVREGLKRGFRVVAVCRAASAEKLDGFSDQDGFTLFTAPEVSDAATLTRALVGCNAVVGVLITVRGLKATELVTALIKATAANGVRRLVFTAGEITAVRAAGEAFTLRQRLMSALIPPLLKLTPYSVTDMLKASVLVAQQHDWEWTIVRAPTLKETPAAGYRFCEISDVTTRHALSREDYAACMLDSLRNSAHHQRTMTVVSADG